MQPHTRKFRSWRTGRKEKWIGFGMEKERACVICKGEKGHAYRAIYRMIDSTWHPPSIISFLSDVLAVLSFPYKYGNSLRGTYIRLRFLPSSRQVSSNMAIVRVSQKSLIPSPAPPPLISSSTNTTERILSFRSSYGELPVIFPDSAFFGGGCFPSALRMRGAAQRHPT